MALNGIDIASYQSTIVPANLKTTDFVIIKATQGATYTNPYFRIQYEQSKSAGKLLGIYHYVNGMGAKDEAEHFVKAVKSVNGIGQAILAVDQQKEYNQKWGDAAYVKELMDEIYALTKVKPFLYVQKSAVSTYNNIQAAGYPLWGAQYANYEQTDYQSTPWTDGKNWGNWGGIPKIRQYSSSGRISGYTKHLDLDLFYGTKEDWKKYAAPVEEVKIGKNTTSTPTKEIQRKLNIIGNYKLVEDGVYGKVTTAAVIEFQKKYKLTVDGIVGNQTLDKINSLYPKAAFNKIPTFKDGEYSNQTILEGKVTTLLNVRQGAGMQYPNITTYRTIAKDTIVGICMKVKGKDAYWYYVKIKGSKGTKYGFCNSNFITII